MIINEFSRNILTSEITDVLQERHLSARPEECAALAARLGVIEVCGLSGDLKVWRDKDNILHLTGRMTAEIVVEDPLRAEAPPQAISAELHDRFALTQKDMDRVFAQEMLEDGDIHLDIEADDPPELLIDDVLDIGEQLVQALALELDPFAASSDSDLIYDQLAEGHLQLPKGIVLNAPVDTVPDAEQAGQTEKENPFAALAALQNKKPS